jgi:DnaA family protein
MCPPRAERYNSPVKQLVLDLIPAPAPSLANFVVGRNREAYSVVSGLLGGSQPAGARVVYLWGEKGSGKTHLLAALTAVAHGGFTAGVPADDSQAAGGYVIDDVEDLDETAQQALFNLMNRLQMNGGALVATGSTAPRDLALRRDLASRLGSGLVFQLQPLSEQERADALRVHARTRGFALRDDVIGYLLRHARRDMATLMSTLDALDAYSIETGREITLPLLKEVSQPMLV